MDKLKKMFKKGDDESTSHSSSSTPAGHGTGHDTAYGGNQGAGYGSNQGSGYGSTQGAGYDTNQGAGQGTNQGAGYGTGQTTQSGSGFPSQNAPSTGREHADRPQGVVMHTTVGDITIALYTQQTPRTCKNFATLAATGKYDGVVFHRIIPGFMIQGGDPDGTGRGGVSIYGAKFEDEFVPDLVHSSKGTLSMANSGPNTNGSQFFITLGPTPHLNGKHTVFGQVAEGLDIVDKLGAVRTDSGDRPLQDVKILRCDVF